MIGENPKKIAKPDLLLPLCLSLQKSASAYAVRLRGPPRVTPLSSVHQRYLRRWYEAAKQFADGEVNLFDSVCIE